MAYETRWGQLGGKSGLVGKNEKARVASLAVIPNLNVPVSKKAQVALETGDPNVRKCGKDGYYLKAIRHGLVNDIALSIYKYRQENPTCSYTELWNNMLCEEYPQVFNYINPRWYGNASKSINQVEEWRTAYMCSTYNLKANVDMKMYKLLNKNDLDDKLVVSAYDKIHRIDLTERQLEKMNTHGENVVTETENTLNNIIDGLKELGGGNNG